MKFTIDYNDKNEQSIYSLVMQAMKDKGWRLLSSGIKIEQQSVEDSTVTYQASMAVAPYLWAERKSMQDFRDAIAQTTQELIVLGIINIHKEKL